MRAWLMAVLLVAGCAGPADTPAEAALEVDGLWLAPGHGALLGSVVSDAGLPVADARVSVVGSEHFGRTDGRGGFGFVNVTAGAYTLQVSSQNFQVHSQDVEIGALRVHRLNITLLPEADTGAGYRPHVHDHWGGRDTYTVIDAAVDLGAKPKDGGYPDAYYQLTNGVVRPLSNGSMWFVPLAQQPDGGSPIVLPGTKTLTVTAAWDADTLDALGICIWRPEDQRCHGPKASPATWTIDVRPQEADSGHAQWSEWRFWLFHDPLSRTMTPAVAMGSVDVRIDIERGHVPVDPPHPDFWDADQVVVLEETRTIQTACCSTHPTLRPEHIVPPGTTRLTIEHAWEFRGAGAGPLDFDYQVLVRTGAMNPHTSALSDFLEPTPVEGSAQEYRKLYELELAPGDADAYYQQRSSWEFVLWNPLFGKDDFYAQHRGVVHDVRIVAYR